MQRRRWCRPKIRRAIRANPRLAAELSYLVPLGIPRSIYHGRGWEPGQPWWTDEDRAYAEAWREEHEAQCSGCRLPRDETMRPEAMWDYDAQPVRCQACAARDRAAKQWSSDKSADPAGIYFAIQGPR